MKMPSLDPDTRRLYEETLPADPGIETKAMFGGLGSFVNGNMFAGALGSRIFVRLPETERRILLEEPGGGPFEPVKGHAMAEYATIPPAWAGNPARVRASMVRSFRWVASLPPKPRKAKRSSKRR